MHNLVLQHPAQWTLHVSRWSSLESLLRMRDLGADWHGNLRYLVVVSFEPLFPYLLSFHEAFEL